MENKTKIAIQAIETYQVPGAVGDFDKNNFKQEGSGIEWSGHVSGTSQTSPRGLERFHLGMPIPFSRLGKAETEINIFLSWEEKEKVWQYNVFNIPCWKFLDKHLNTLVRGLSNSSTRLSNSPTFSRAAQTGQFENLPPS